MLRVQFEFMENLEKSFNNYQILTLRKLLIKLPQIIEPRREKICLQGFRAGPTQNRTAQPQKMARDLKFQIEEE